MMKVRILVPFDGFEVGQEVDLDTTEASRLISGRWAAPVRGADVERAVAEPAPERAAKGKTKT